MAQRAEELYAEDVAPSKPNRMLWLLRKLDAAQHAPINPASRHAKPVTISEADMIEYSKLMADAPFEQVDVWLLLDFECAMPSAHARLRRRTGLACAQR